MSKSSVPKPINNKALLVIDMQKGSFTPATPRYDARGVIERINCLAELFRQSGHTIIFIQHDGTGSGEFEKGSHSWELLDELVVGTDDVLVDKYANDVFYQSQLQHLLSTRGITELYMAGCATDFCVEATIQSALVKDYQVTVLGDAHTTADRPHLKAEKVIEHYNWVWQNMIPTKGRVEVKSSGQVMEETGI